MPAPKLTPSQVLEVRDRYGAGGVSQQTLAIEYGIHQTAVSQIVRGASNGKTRSLVALRAEGKKQCHACGEVKSLDDFPRNRTVKFDGRSSSCLVCTRGRNRANHAANPEPGRDRAARWLAENPERGREIRRKARSTRRARLRDAFVEEVDPQVLYERDEGVCGICELPVERDRFDVDHIVPLALGGEHSYANTRVAHVSCNRRRGRQVALSVASQTHHEGRER